MSPGAKAREQQVKAEILWVQSDSFVCRTYVMLCRKHPNNAGPSLHSGTCIRSASQDKIGHVKPLARYMPQNNGRLSLRGLTYSERGVFSTT